MREISERITELCAERIRVKNAESAAILGYCVSLAMGAVKNGDGSISYSRFYGAKSKVQTIAEQYVDDAINTLQKERSPKKSLDNFTKKFLACF